MTCSIFHSGHFYSASSSGLLFRGAPDTVQIPYRSFTPKRQRQLLVKDFPKVPKWRLERASNPRPFGRKAANLPICHHTPQLQYLRCSDNQHSVQLFHRTDCWIVGWLVARCFRGVACSSFGFGFGRLWIRTEAAAVTCLSFQWLLLFCTGCRRFVNN